MNTNAEKVLKFITARKMVKASDVAKLLGVSRQYASQLLKSLVHQELVIKLGSIRNAKYTVPKFADTISAPLRKQRLKNKELKEHEVLENFMAPFLPFRRAPENIRSILRYAFSEMLNNAIEHSRSATVEVGLKEDGGKIQFIVSDFGVGVFRNIMKQHHLKSEFEAMQDLLKGKTTTAPQAHSGEGIFFTSKVADRFVLESFGHRMVVDNILQDVFFEKQKPSKRGTRVIFSVAQNNKRHLNDVFKKFQSDPEELAFDKTEIHVRLFTIGTVYVSRSQARRIVIGLEKFKSVILDFAHVPSVGQAFADEIFRVFKKQHPEVTVTPVHMNEAVRFMIERVDFS